MSRLWMTCETFSEWMFAEPFSSLADVETAIAKVYAGHEDSIEDVIGQLESGHEDDGKMRGIDIGDMDQMSDAAPIRKLLNMILLLAIKDQASDIHFEPFEDEFKVRVKADGVLYEMVPPPRHLANAIVSRNQGDVRTRYR